MEHLRWRKSRRSSGQGGNCVEIAELPNGGAAVRDSKDPTGPVLSFSSDRWGEAVQAVSRGEFG